MPSPSDDIIDSREVIEEIEDLQGEISCLSDDIEELREEIDDLETEQENLDLEGDDVDDQMRYDAIDDEIAELEREISNKEIEISAVESELKPLADLQEDAEGYSPDWRSGATLIADDHFEDYAYELACDIGAIDRNASWPADCIDWEKAADELKMDYTSVDYDGVTFWVRS